MSSDPFAQQTIPSAAPRYHQGRKMFGGRYTLLRPLGRGGMGEVWLAQDNELGVQRALKFAPPEVAADARSVAILKREAIAGTSLAHPNIVRIFDFASDAAAMESAVVMEVVEGKSLTELQAQRIEESGNGFFEPEEIERWLRDVCAALEYAHGEGRAHRDLKPQNLMVETASGRLKIMDFGISRRIGDSFSQLTGTDSSGTLPYMSPQQVMGEPPGTSDDIYGLGATLYDLLTGSPPFIGGALEIQVREKRPSPMMARRAEVNASSGKPVAKAWEDLVMACLDKQREKRPASFDAIRQTITAPNPAPTPKSASSTAGDEEERQRVREVQERQRREAQAAATPQAQAGASAKMPEHDDVYAEYFAPGASGGSELHLMYLPVSPRSAWLDRKHEAGKIARHLGPGADGAQAASSVVASVAFARRHLFKAGVMLCCEVRPDHVCCSWLEIADGVHEELGSWAIDSTGLTEERLAARVWGSCEGMRAPTLRDPAQIQCFAVTHSCEATRAQARGLSGKLPGKTCLWEDHLPAAIFGAQSGVVQSDTLLLLATPCTLSIRLPDQSLLPVLKRFTTIPMRQCVELSWAEGRKTDAVRIELVEETDRGVVPVKSQAVASSVCVIQDGKVKTRIEVDIDARWQVSLKLDAPPVSGPPPLGKTAARTAPQNPAQNTPPPLAASKPPPHHRAPAGTTSRDHDFTNMNQIATVLTVLLIVGSFVAALVLRPDWDNLAYWRNGSIILLLLMLCACGAEKDGNEISKRLLGPVVVALVAAILFAITAWLWPRTASTELDRAARRFSESKVFTAPDTDTKKAEQPPMPASTPDFEMKSGEVPVIPSKGPPTN